MAKRKKQIRDDRRAAAAPDVTADPKLSTEDQISYSSLSLHQLFEQQTRQMLDRTDLDEEQKQNIRCQELPVLRRRRDVVHGQAQAVSCGQPGENRSDQRSHDMPAIRGSLANAIWSNRIVLGGDCKLPARRSG